VCAALGLLSCSARRTVRASPRLWQRAREKKRNSWLGFTENRTQITGRIFGLILIKIRSASHYTNELLRGNPQMLTTLLGTGCLRQAVQLLQQQFGNTDPAHPMNKLSRVTSGKAVAWQRLTNGTVRTRVKKVSEPALVSHHATPGAFPGSHPTHSHAYQS
jgi:hypothetical protein